MTTKFNTWVTNYEVYIMTQITDSINRKIKLPEFIYERDVLNYFDINNQMDDLIKKLDLIDQYAKNYSLSIAQWELYNF